MREKSERFNVWGVLDAQVLEGAIGRAWEEMCEVSTSKDCPHHLPSWQPARRWDLSSPVSTNSLSEPGSRFFPGASGKEGCPADVMIPPLGGWKDPAESPWTCDWQQNCVIIKCCLKPRSLWGFVMWRQWTHAPFVGWSRASSSKRGSQRSLNLSRSLRGKNTKMSLACFTGLTFGAKATVSKTAGVSTPFEKVVPGVLYFSLSHPRRKGPAVSPKGVLGRAEQLHMLLNLGFPVFFRGWVTRRKAPRKCLCWFQLRWLPQGNV